jgi:DNA-binding beta-propeller fold protein YncE
MSNRLDFAARLIAHHYRPWALTTSITAALTMAISCLTGCDSGSIAPGGVVGVFGEVGLGEGAFSYPRAITADDRGSVFVVDKSGRIQRFAPDGQFELMWRMPEGAAGKPVGFSVHPDGRIFVADTHYNRVVVFDRDGRELARFGQEGTGPGEFLLPTDVAFDADGYIYVGEYGGNDRISRWTPDFRFDTVIGDGPIDGKRLNRPSGIDFDDEQTLWIADSCNHRLVRLSRNGDILGVFGEFGEEPGRMRYPFDLCITPDQKVLVCEYQGNRLQWFDKEGRSLRVWGRSGRKPGELFAPWGATYGRNGRVYVVDSLNSRIQIIQP